MKTLREYLLLLLTDRRGILLAIDITGRTLMFVSYVLKRIMLG